MNKIVVRGAVDQSAVRPDIADLLPGQITPKYSARTFASRDDAQAIPLNVLPDDYVEIELGSGVRLWTRVDQLPQDFPGFRPRDATPADSYELPNALPLGGATRGVGDLVIKGLKVFGWDVPGSVAQVISEKVEGQLRNGPGLFRCSLAGPGDLKPVGKLETSTPILVLIHGTASSTKGSFSGLWEGGASAPIAALFATYDQQVLALEHKTFTESPIANALDLAKALPKGATLHLVSHSRGGIVGELMCRAMAVDGQPIDDDEIAAFESLDRNSDADALRALRDVLKVKNFKVERFARVGCPARGTTLAGKRLDRYLSIMVNLIKRIPGAQASLFVDGVSALLLAVIKERTDPRSLPGLEAQMPESPLVAVLNRPGRMVDSTLRVIGGDVAGDSFFGALRAFAVDLYYGEDNDLIVNTASMFGGAERREKVRYWIDTGGNVDHFHYFRNTETSTRVVAALTSPNAALFHEIDKKPSQITPNDYRKRALEPQPHAILIPGIMGSNLKLANGTRIWMDFVQLGFGGLTKLGIDVKGIVPDELVADSYLELVRFLSDSHEVTTFAYDWRHGIDDAATALRKTLEDIVVKAEQDKQPVRIIAHSMGGLVVRCMLATKAGEDLWKRMCANPGSRFIMLGTPNGGSHAIAGMLIGRDSLVKKLALLDLKHSYAELLETITGFDGVLQLMPHAGSIDLYEIDEWKKVRDEDLAGMRGIGTASLPDDKFAGFEWPLPEEARLAKARAIRDAIKGSPIDPVRMIYVAGRAPQTPNDIRINATADPGRRVIVFGDDKGDGRVPWDTGIPKGLEGQTYLIEAVHGDLANVPDTFPALLDLLNSGTTSKLPHLNTRARGGATESFEMQPESPKMFPDEEDILVSALGCSRRGRARAAATRVEVRVVHGDMRQAEAPVMVGHYVGDDIVNAEAYLDRQLQGRLRDAFRLRRYADRLNTAKVFLNEDTGGVNRIPGGIIVGLGTVGDLTAGALSSTVANGVAEFALACIDRERALDARNGLGNASLKTLQLKLTTLLIGSGEAGIGLDDSILSILRGVAQANRRLEELPAPADPGRREGPRARITHVDFIERWEDRAIQAVHGLRRLSAAAEVRRQFDVEELLVTRDGGFRRVHFDEDQTWWQRVRIATQDNGGLKFEVFSQRARIPTYLQPTQRKLVEKFLRSATSSTSGNVDVSYTLFEMLVPNELKEAAPDQRNIVALLDASAATFPWELMQNRFDEGGRPLAVQAGFIRQLISPDIRADVTNALQHTALVIGDPSSADPANRFPPLPGATEEASAVATILESNGYAVTALVEKYEKKPEQVLTKLHADKYRILHLAGHGVFEFELPPEDPAAAAALAANPCAPRMKVSGMVLGEGIFLTPAEVEQMHFVPELVFINCCHLGQMRDEAAGEPSSALSEEMKAKLRDDRHKLAANLAAQFIRMGVRAVVAAGWAVNDADAKTFATKFYEAMMAGWQFGDAVRVAREETYGSGSSNSWGAYQCYGNPAFVLTTNPRDDGPGRDRLVSNAELVARLLNLATGAGSADENYRRVLCNQLDELAEHTEQAWLELAATCAAFGMAYSQLGKFDKAIRYYGKARSCKRSDNSVESLEQLVNLSARFANELLRSAALGTAPDSKKNRDKAEQLLSDAEPLIDALLRIGPTLERQSIKGSFYKRKAMAARTAAERTDALREMVQAYGKALEIGKDNKSDNTFYPLANQLAGEIVLGWPPPSKSKKKEKTTRGQDSTVTVRLKELDVIVSNRSALAKDFWGWIQPAELQLARCAAKQRINDDELDSIVDVYRTARQRGGSEREMLSVIDQLLYYETMAIRAGNLPEDHSFLAGLRAIRAKLGEH